MLEFDWQTEDDLEVKFSITFTPDSGGETVLIAPKNNKAQKDKVEVNEPGACLLLWTNYYTLFQAPVLRYSASIRSMQDIRDEEARLEAKRQQAEAKRQALDAKIASLREEVAKMQQHDIVEQQDICIQRKADVITLRERLRAMEVYLSTAVAHHRELEANTNAKLQEIDALKTERREIYGANGQSTAEQTTAEQTTEAQTTLEPTTPTTPSEGKELQAILARRKWVAEGKVL